MLKMLETIHVAEIETRKKRNFHKYLSTKVEIRQKTNIQDQTLSVTN